MQRPTDQMLLSRELVEMKFSCCDIHFLLPSAEKNTGKTGECFVFVWTRSGAHEKSFSKIHLNFNTSVFYCHALENSL